MLNKIQTALISVFYKDGIDEVVKQLHANGVHIYSTGGTRTHIEQMGIPVIAVEDLTGYPSILGGRVKTLHPKVFGAILARRELASDMQELSEYAIPTFDLVMVDLYPFNETVASGAARDAIIEKIDIGGVSLIRAAAKNHAHTAIVAQKEDISFFAEAYQKGNGALSKEDRTTLAARAFAVTAQYDTDIAAWFSGVTTTPLRYGENPHQPASFRGNLDALFEKIQGKELSYNNLLDIDAAWALVSDFSAESGATFAIIKHNNACGIATRATVGEAWDAALACDPVSAFGGILATNHPIDDATAGRINDLFFEVIMAPGYSEGAIDLLKSKKNRIILRTQGSHFKSPTLRTILNGELIQERDTHVELRPDMKQATEKAPLEHQWSDLEFALKVVKHTKSNAIVLVKDGQLMASGTGQTSRVDALKQAIEKAQHFGFDLQGAVMASDAFFPFPDCVEIAHHSGITAVVQPGGSVKDSLSIDYCNAQGIAMVFTGIRHFKH